MRRFDSPIQSIQRVQQQQLKLVELKLLQAQLRVRNCEEMIAQLNEQKQQVELAMKDRFQSQALMAIESMKSMFASRDHSDELNNRLLVELGEARTHLANVEEEYRSFKARCQGTDELLEKQKSEHRQESFRRQQVDLEDNARSVSFVNDRLSERKIES